MGETCKEVPAEEYVVHVVEATNLYTRLRFSLLASSWLPRPVGVCLWSVLHAVLVVYVLIIPLPLFTIVLVLAVFFDAIVWFNLLSFVLFLPLIILFAFLGIALGCAIAWIWLVITCQCCTMAGREPGQSLGSYIVFAGGRLRNPQQPVPVEEVGTAARPELICFTVQLFKHVNSVSFPYWRSKLKDYCQEVVPLYDTVVI